MMLSINILLLLLYNIRIEVACKVKTRYAIFDEMIFTRVIVPNTEIQFKEKKS